MSPTASWPAAHRAPGRIGEPDQVRAVCEAPWPSAEGYRVVWVHDSAKQQCDAATRARRIEEAVAAIEDDLAGRLASPRSRLRTAAAVHAAAKDAIAGVHGRGGAQPADRKSTRLNSSH